MKLGQFFKITFFTNWKFILHLGPNCEAEYPLAEFLIRNSFLLQDKSTLYQSVIKDVSNFYISNIFEAKYLVCKNRFRVLKLQAWKYENYSIFPRLPKCLDLLGITLISQFVVDY